ncbi:hypothetical protein N658DRAFT_519804 [Parathielavia hyrcaniae]|uniref:Heterokaryon incompatibility domain-containing protein n=1 Tax=Parathielavia hyrcaniae TaxID=113614 RepID=A0AAN6QCD2_9PEZI|nr:hypothetical protein N658DRAFT_519804 [Parathielavia hyrcaniae]
MRISEIVSMDFLPHPTSGVEPLDIPFVADTPYVFGTDFWGFPKLHGFGDQWASLPAPRLASLAQSWLYFGTISEFLGTPIDYREFQVSRSVSGKPLLPLLNDWLAVHAITTQGATARGAHENEDQKQVLYEHAKFLDAVIQLAEGFDKVSHSHVKPLPTVILSVKVLCITLRGVLWDLARGDLYESLRPWPSPVTRLRREVVPARDTPGKQTLPPSAQLMLDVLRLRGWCPFYARKVLTSYNYAVAYYLTRLFRIYSPGLSHQSCSDDECVASNADIFSYVPKHARRGCLCQPKSAPMDQIRAIIEDGGVPLIRLRGSSKSGVRIEVTRMTAWTRFVVVSHVWSDGIGNANTNALPECQLRRLHAHMSELKPLGRSGDRDAEFNLLSSLDTGFQSTRARRPSYLWIDALCMPPGGPAAPLRLRAINKLPAVYQAADRILVLDSTMERTSVVDSDSLEQFARFAVSPWMGRSWTFQEAALASACEVQCSDGTFDAFSPQPKQRLAAATATAKRKRLAWLEALTRPGDWAGRVLSRKPRTEMMQLANSSSTMGVDITASMVRSLTRSLSEEYRSAFANGVKPSRAALGEGRLAPDFCTLFVQVWNELSKRATTVPGDMHIIMASLLGFHAEPLVRLPRSAERMSCILRSMDGIPVSLLFNTDGPRHNPSRNHRDRWLPLYPSRQRLTFGSAFTNLRSIRDDLYLPNNTVSRRKVAVFVCTGEVDPFSSCTFTLWNVSLGEQYSVVVHRQEGEVDEFATPDIGPYCIAIQLDSETDWRPDGQIGSPGAAPRTFAGALFRVRRVVPNVKKLYHHNLETDYEKSFELVEDEAYGTTDLETASKRATGYLDGNLASAFLDHHLGILRTVYDCPLTVSCVPGGVNSPQPPSKDNPTLSAQPLPETWQLVIEREPATHPSPLPSRTPFAEAITPVSSYLAITALDGLVASGCVGLAIALCATMFPDLALLARAAVVAKLGLHSVFLVQMFLFPGVEVRLVWDVLHLALVALYTVSRVTTTTAARAGAGVGGMDALDWSFIGWAFLGHAVDFVARLGIQWVVVPRLFERYMESFDGDDEAFGKHDPGGGLGGRMRVDRGWWHRARVRLGWGLGLGPGRRKGYRYHQGQGQEQHLDYGSREEVPVYWRAEQHLLGDMERQI